MGVEEKTKRDGVILDSVRNFSVALTSDVSSRVDEFFRGELSRDELSRFSSNHLAYMSVQLLSMSGGGIGPLVKLFNETIDNVSGDLVAKLRGNGIALTDYSIPIMNNTLRRYFTHQMGLDSGREVNFDDLYFNIVSLRVLRTMDSVGNKTCNVERIGRPFYLVIEDNHGKYAVCTGCFSSVLSAPKVEVPNELKK